VSKEKTYPMAPEKKKPVLSSKADNVKSEKHEMQSGIIALEQHPSQDIIHLFGLAVSYQKQGEITKAMEAYIKVIDIEPMNVEAHNNLGVIYKDMGKFNQAVREFRTVLSMIPRQEKARNNLGVIFYLQENLEEAIQEFRKVLDVNTGNRDAYINLGVA
jgi:Flp pilus assembly protein TadD